MIRVKICGIGAPADACIAAEAGADFIGMVFVPERHRRITPDAAREIVDAVHDLGAPHPRMVGLFADQPLEEVNETIAHCGLDAVQLCGKESVEYTADVDCQVVKVVHVPASYRAPDDVPQLAERVGEYADAGCLVTLDRFVEGHTGRHRPELQPRSRRVSGPSRQRILVGWRPHFSQRWPHHQQRQALGRRCLQRRGDPGQEGPSQDPAIRRKRATRRRRPHRLRLKCRHHSMPEFASAHSQPTLTGYRPPQIPDILLSVE